MCIDLDLGVEIHSARISTLPPKGPYRIGQTVLFSCEVDKEENVTITWNILANIFGGYEQLGKSFNWTSHRYNQHYCLFYCRVAVNGTVIGKAKRVIEVQGKAQ